MHQSILQVSGWYSIMVYNNNYKNVFYFNKDVDFPIFPKKFTLIQHVISTSESMCYLQVEFNCKKIFKNRSTYKEILFSKLWILEKWSKASYMLTN